MDSDEDAEEHQNEPGTSSTSPPTVPVLLYHQGPAANSHGPIVLDNSADEDSENSNEYSAQSQDAQRTLYYPDVYVLTNDDHTPETHKYTAAAGPFRFVTTEHGDQQHICKRITMPCVQRSVYLNERTNNFGNMNVEGPKEVDSRTRDMLERCMATLRKSSKNKSQDEISYTEGSIRSGNTRILQEFAET